jgi:hypothetical protein
LPKLAAEHPEVILLAGVFQHYKERAGLLTII